MKGDDTDALSKTAPENHLRSLQDEGAPLSIVYPPGVIGPDDPGLSEAMRRIQQIMQASVMITSSGFQTVDVRDLAALHTALIERTPPRRGRYIATGRFLPWEECAELLDRAAGIRLPRAKIPGRAGRFFGRVGDRLRPFFAEDPALSREATRLATQWVAFDASRAESELGVVFRDPVETLMDTVRCMAAKGHIDEGRALRFTHPGRGRQSAARPEP